jgi:hypothetical protein
LAAFESGKLEELGYSRVARICSVVDLELEARPLGEAVMDHRHLTELAGRKLTRAAIDDIITNGDVELWRSLLRAVRADETGRLAQRVRDVAAAAAPHDSKAHAFRLLLPTLLGGREHEGRRG